MEIVFRPESHLGTDLALKLFNALNLIRANYGLEIYMRVETSITSSCMMGCGPPKIYVGGTQIVLEDSQTPESLANLIVEAIFNSREVSDAEEAPFGLSRRTPSSYGVIAA
ncbi:MAG: hypothetical protein F7B20_06420 [Aeropyrum sp.]|nr:hypothetical protein [Aeropyrum sp.]MCE4616313.1 hypothetical protein [Aeropyrum sp.]